MNHGPKFQKVRPGVHARDLSSADVVAAHGRDQSRCKGNASKGELRRWYVSHAKSCCPRSSTDCQASGPMDNDSEIASRWEAKACVSFPDQDVGDLS